MASKKEDAPQCPKCGRSNGIEVDVTGTAVWRNGAWRWSGDPHTEFGDGDYRCTSCGHEY